MATFCVLVWGLSFSVTRDAVRQIPPLTLACLRFFLAGVLLWLLTRKHTVALRPEDRKWVGALTLSGVTKPVVLEAKFYGAGKGPAMMGGKENVGFTAKGKIMRSEFGVGYGIPMVSDEVSLKIAAAFVK